MKRTNIYFDESQYKSLRKLADRESVSVSAFIRQIVQKEIDYTKDSQNDVSNDPLVKVMEEVIKNSVAVKNPEEMNSENFREYLYGRNPRYGKSSK